MISELLENGPSVSKSRVVEGFISRVKTAYPAVVRERKSFSKVDILPDYLGTSEKAIL
jgi:hypothetical protein